MSVHATTSNFIFSFRNGNNKKVVFDVRRYALPIRNSKICKQVRMGFQCIPNLVETSTISMPSTQTVMLS